MRVNQSLPTRARTALALSPSLSIRGAVSSKDGNICRGKFREFKFVTSIRLFGNYARLITKEIHNDASYGVDLLFSPDQFKLGGFNGVGHP